MAKIVYIADVCKEIFAGGDVPKSALSYEKTAEYNVPIFSNGEKNCGLYGYTNNARVKEPSITVSARGTIGYTAIRTEPFVPVVRLITLTPKSEVIDLDYLFYATQNYKFEGSGTSIPQLTVPMLKKYKFQLPEMSHQKAIAVKFEKLDQLISLRKQQLAKLDELVKARFVEMFGDPVSNPMGWKRVRFDSISENLDSKRVPVTESDRKDGVYPYYGASGIVDWINDYIFDEDILLVSEDGANLLMRSTPIAFSVSGKSWVNNHAHVVRFHDFATQKFIEVYFSLIDISEYITGTAQPKLNQAKLNTMLFCWPPLSLQKQFAAFVERVDQQKQTVQQSLEKLELMKKALMQEYFG
jgi:hypothetical protein